MNKPKLNVYAVRVHFIDGTSGDCAHFADEADAYERRREMLAEERYHVARLLGIANVTVHPIAVW